MSLRLGSYKSYANGRSSEERAKVSAFSFEIQHYVLASVYV